MTPNYPFLQTEKQGSVVVDLHVVPNAKTSGAEGVYDGALRLRLKAPPVDGKANAAVIEWLSDNLHVPRAALTLVRGQTSRRKQVRVQAQVVSSAHWAALEPPA